MILIMAVISITAISLYPLKELPKALTFKFHDKVAHFIMFGTLQYLLMLRFVNITTFKKVLACLLITLFYSILIEVLQDLLPFNRMGDFYDVIANFSGILAATIIYYKQEV